jgi:HD-GYP domain-containing protein (c-di-GMP phosphodiesterase class II)
LSRASSRSPRLRAASSPLPSFTGDPAETERRFAAAMERIQGLEGEIGKVLEAMHEKVEQLELLNEFSSLLNSTLEPAKVRKKALEATCALIRCETASLYLIDEESNQLYWETALGEAGEALQKSMRLPLDHKSIAGSVALTGKAELIADVAKDPRTSKKSLAVAQAKKFFARNMLCVPLKVKGSLIGVLQGINKEKDGQFSAHDLKLLESLGHQVSIAVDNSRLYGEIRESFFHTVEALSEAIEKKDRYTGGHTKRVVHFSLCIARHMGLSPEALEELKLAAVLHDVGKIGIEDSILKKQAPLDKDEWKVMQTHPAIGFDIMKRVRGLESVTDGMRYHHEKWDGTGYPAGLKGEKIPLVARIIAVADTYDAMVSTRPYRKGLPPQVAFDEISKHSGTQFDPEVVAAFVKAYELDGMGKKSAIKAAKVGSAESSV